MTASLERVRGSFEADTKDHLLTIIHDAGLHRHLRFAHPETSVYRFDLLTWPGYLAYVGDAGDFLFRRITDMFDFFTGQPNPGYWSKKLVAPTSDAALTFSPPHFEKAVNAWAERQIEEHRHDHSAEELAVFRTAVKERLLDQAPLTTYWAIHLLDAFDFEWPDGATSAPDEPWEWSLKEWDFRFAWACCAIPWGIERYREHAKKK